MKKDLKTVAENNYHDSEDEYRDPVDGRSIVGCLFIGLLIIAGIIVGLGVLIKQIR